MDDRGKESEKSTNFSSFSYDVSESCLLFIVFYINVFLLFRTFLPFFDLAADDLEGGFSVDFYTESCSMGGFIVSYSTGGITTASVAPATSGVGSGLISSATGFISGVGCMSAVSCGALSPS